jgi:hypothetical protein
VGRETNRQRREKQAATAREKAAAARAAQARVDQRRRAKVVLSSVGALGIAVVLIVVLVITQQGKVKNNPSGDRTSASQTIVNAVTGVSPATFNEVGQGSANLDAVKSVADTPLTDNGKPEVFGVFAEFCPYCAAERWSLINALSRFGTFSGLKQIRSATGDGNLATFSFYQSSYTSKYLSFVPVENADRNSARLEALSKAQQAIFSKYTNGYPFIDYGGKYVQTQVGFSDQDLSGLNWTQITDDLKDPSSTIARDILGEANIDTALICKLTNGQPGSVCNATGLDAISLPTSSA